MQRRIVNVDRRINDEASESLKQLLPAYASDRARTIQEVHLRTLIIEAMKLVAFVAHGRPDNHRPFLSPFIHIGRGLF